MRKAIPQRVMTGQSCDMEIPRYRGLLDRDSLLRSQPARSWILRCSHSWKSLQRGSQAPQDGWVFPLSFVSKSLLIWLQATFLRWVDEDGSLRNRQWIEGIAEAFQDGLAGKL